MIKFVGELGRRVVIGVALSESDWKAILENPERPMIIDLGEMHDGCLGKFDFNQACLLIAGGASDEKLAAMLKANASQFPNEIRTHRENPQA